MRGGTLHTVWGAAIVTGTYHNEALNWNGNDINVKCLFHFATFKTVFPCTYKKDCVTCIIHRSTREAKYHYMFEKYRAYGLVHKYISGCSI